VSDSVTIKQGDTLPVLRRRFTDDSGGVIDLSAASSVNFRMRPIGSNGEPTVEAAATIDDPAPSDPDDPQVSYAWQAGDTAMAGTYEAEFEIVFATGDRLTVPNDGAMIVHVVPEIG